MPKHDDRHLTTTQLSAFIDKQLSEQELAACQSHLETCQQCQSALASLRQTVAFLHAMPQPALPRSFTLPESVTFLQERPERHSQEERQARANPPVRRSRAYYIQRSLRVASAIAAVIGLAFLLSGIIPLLPHGESASTASGTTAAPSNQGSSLVRASNTSTSSPTTATVQKAAPADQHPTPVGTSKPSATPGNTNAALPPTRVKGSSTQNTSTNSSNQPLATFPDLGTPLVRQGIGFILLVFGIVSLLLARRKPRRRENQR